MLYRDNEILIFDEPGVYSRPRRSTSCWPPCGSLPRRKSILFISHKLNEIMAVADRVTVLRRESTHRDRGDQGYGQAVPANMMWDALSSWRSKRRRLPGTRCCGWRISWSVQGTSATRSTTSAFEVHAGGDPLHCRDRRNGQTELVYGLTGLEKSGGGSVTLCGHRYFPCLHPAAGDPDEHIRRTGTSTAWCSTLRWAEMVLQRFQEPQFQHMRIIDRAPCAVTPEHLIEQYDVRSDRGRSPSPAACPAATSKRPSSPGRSTGKSPGRGGQRPKADLSWAPSSTSTANWWPSGTRGRAVLLVSPGAGRGHEPVRPHPRDV